VGQTTRQSRDKVFGLEEPRNIRSRLPELRKVVDFIGGFLRNTTKGLGSLALLLGLRLQGSLLLFLLEILLFVLLVLFKSFDVVFIVLDVAL